MQIWRKMQKRWSRQRPPIARQTYTVAETAEVIGIGRTKLYALWRERKGPPRRRIGTRVVVPRALLHKWLEERCDD